MKTMKLVLAIVIAAWMPALAWAGTAPGSGIQDTAHDFSTNSDPTTDVGLCTFCHTPHKALTTLLLWNHTLSTNEFKWDVPATTGGTTFPTFKGDTYAGVSAKCLSCHDGSVAIGDVVLFRENWTGNGTGVVLDASKHGSGDLFNVGFNGDMAGNHPVAMPYPFGNVTSTYNGVSTGAQVVLTEFKADPTSAGIRLFNNAGAATPSNGDAGLECSSCHDPHNGGTVMDDLFVRGHLGGSDADYICTKCHTK